MVFVGQEAGWPAADSRCEPLTELSAPDFVFCGSVLSDRSIPATPRDQHYSDNAWNDALLREGSLLYVADTRARDESAVTWTGRPSTLPGEKQS